MSALTGKRVLVLEDEYLLAVEATDTLEELGAIVVGPAHHVDAALALIAQESIDAALLDVNINGKPSIPVAEVLTARRVPYVFATGYGAAADVPEGARIVDKPYTRDDIAKAFSSALAETTRA